MIVLKYAQILTSAIPAPVILDIVWQVIVADVQKLMNVLKEHMDVVKLVRTLLEAIHAPVIQDIAWQAMDKHVMVSLVLNLQYVSSRKL